MNNGLLGSARGRTARLRKDIWEYAYLEERYAAQTFPGAVGQGVWHARPNLLIQEDDGGLLTRLSSTQFRMNKGGTYRFNGHCTFMGTNRARCRVWDVTHGRSFGQGLSPHSYTQYLCQVLAPMVGWSDQVQQGSIIEFQQYVQTTQGATWGMGHWGSHDDDEVYAQLEVIRVGA